MTDKFTLEWLQYEDGGRVLVFDPKTWAIFEEAASAEGKTAQQQIMDAIWRCRSLMTDKLALGWAEREDGSRAVVFDEKAWATFEEAADAKGETAKQLISTAVAEVLGAIPRVRVKK
jgi:hypothetical protein